MNTHPRGNTLGDCAAFLLRRVAMALHAAILVVLLFVTTVGLQFERAVVRELWGLLSRAARVFAGWRRRPHDPELSPLEHDDTESAIIGRWLPAVHERALLALRDAAQKERHDIGRFRQSAIHATYHTAPDGVSQPSAAILVRDPATWRELAYWLTAIALSFLTAIGVALAWFAPVGMIAVPLLIRLLGDPDSAPGAEPDPEWLTSLSTADSVLLVALAVAVVLLAAQVTRAAAAVHAGLGAALLSPSGQARLQAELEEQRARRRLAVAAAENERRRIERDLHDGAQQRLVTLAMNLGMARQKFATDPAGAQQLVAEAHADAKHALGELRALARGIHPAVLTDRGLDAALSALAGRVGVPVDVVVELDHRPPTSIESAAYFVVAEALTNVARHAGATQATVSVVGRDERVIVEIADDGSGGADPAGGTGLAGLAERVGSIDGSLAVVSPPGGPTVVRAELPCVS